MQPPMLTKFGVRIRTRMGLVVDNLLIAGRDAVEAERKLRQIYRDCEILEWHCRAAETRPSRSAATTRFPLARGDRPRTKPAATAESTIQAA